MATKWKLRQGQLTVVEDAETASLVIVGRDLKSKDDKILAVEQVLEKLRAPA